MTVINHGVWLLYTPDPFPEDLPRIVIFAKRNSDGADWYEYRKTLESSDTVKLILRQEDGHWTVKVATRDPALLFPDGCLLLTVDDATEDDPRAKYIGKIFSGGNVVDRPVVLSTYASTKRWQKEISGVAWNGHTIATDREASQGKLIAEFVALVAGQREEPSPWKFAGGEFVMLSNADMQTVCLTARGYIAGLYAIEGTVQAGIAGGTITTTSQIDEAFDG